MSGWGRAQAFFKNFSAGMRFRDILVQSAKEGPKMTKPENSGDVERGSATQSIKIGLRTCDTFAYHEHPGEQREIFTWFLRFPVDMAYHSSRFRLGNLRFGFKRLVLSLRSVLIAFPFRSPFLEKWFKIAINIFR